MSDDSEDFANAQELQLLQDSVATLLDRAGVDDRARNARGSRDGVNRAIWTELAEAGVLCVMTDEDAGGLGLGLQAGGIIAREFGRTLAPEPFGSVVGLAAGLLERLTSEHTLLGEIISGEKVPSLAWAERDTPNSEGGKPNTNPNNDEALEYQTHYDAGKLNGTKAWVARAGVADIHMVIASNPIGTGLYLVDAVADGITTKATKQSDGSFLYDITYVETPATLIAEGPEVTKALNASIDDATALAASELLGVAGEALKLTIEFLKTREQFGKPIGTFQALQHRAVDMHIAYEIADAGIKRSLAIMDATDWSKDPTTRGREASRAKARAGDAAQKITRETIQMHGAVGYTDEFDIGLYLNRALTLSAWLGDATTHRKRWLELRGA